LIRVLKFLCVAMAVRKMHKINRKSPGYGSLIEISVEKISMAAGQTHTHIMSIIGFELQFGPQLVVCYVKLSSSDFYTLATDGLTICTSGGYFDVW